MTIGGTLKALVLATLVFCVMFVQWLRKLSDLKKDGDR